MNLQNNKKNKLEINLLKNKINKNKIKLLCLQKD